jgi:hypothetical protein
MAMNTSGSLDASVVMASVIVGADGSMVSGTYSMSSLRGEPDRNPRKPTS